MKSPKLPGLSGHSKILFVNEGNPVAMLVIHTAGRHRTAAMKFPQAEAALAWCRHNAAMLIYCPVALERN